MPSPLGEGQTDAPINHNYLGEVPPILACFHPKPSSQVSHELKCGHSARIKSNPISNIARVPYKGFSYFGYSSSIRFDGAVWGLSLISSGEGNLFRIL